MRTGSRKAGREETHRLPSGAMPPPGTIMFIMEMFGFNDGALHRLHETLKDAIDPNGIVSPGRYDIWPKRLRGSRA